MSNNSVILEGCILQYMSENQLTTNESESFELFTLSQITKSLDITFENIQNSIVDGGNDGGIDSIILLVEEEVIETKEDLEAINFSNKTTTKFVISQCKKESSFKELTIDKLITSIPILFDLEKKEDSLISRFNLNLVEKTLILRECWMKTSINGGTIKIRYNYCCNATKVEINGVFKDKTQQLLEITNNAFSGAKIQYSNFSSEELLKLYQTRKPARLSINYKDQPLSTSYGDKGIGYVGTVKMGDYKELLSDPEGNIREYLFESNIRHFQGLVDVNKKIKDTINLDSNEDFWWLNNGITIIAENPNQVGRVLSVDNIQIVNGLQTSYSIFNNHNGNIEDERSVLVKVIINNDNEIIDNIIASTNSQNQVSPTLLRATEDTQRKIELFFLNEGYYYDRRKNYYKNIGKPASKIFSIQLTAQAIETIVFDSPHSARSKPTSLIKEDTTYQRIFNPEIDFSVYLNCCLIFKKTNDHWVSFQEPEKKSKIANFKMHLSRIAASLLLGKANLDFENLSTMDVDKYDESILSDAMEILLEIILGYQETDPMINLINLAKSKPLSDKILLSLKDKFVN
ncbi:AIPR family protein [Desulfobacula sp.]|uniref:AIPR family protein n=1 Tax=Desulfobacula sp. TaxID=2593537 RepID=UPI0025B7F011|nr:AIPR family protein [Desulfobacula sp.]MBC2704721.1 AIPR family protein [Desulfobacula sp.]